MIFHVLNGGEKKSYEPSNAYLIRNNWDDYGFKTTFYLVYARANGEAETIGSVKIMRRGMRSGYVDVPDTFELLDDDYCSLGQDQNYYETLAGFYETVHEPILVGLRDCVNRPDIFNAFAHEQGMETSLLRSVSIRNVTQTFRGVLRGQAPLTPYRFSYTYPTNENGEGGPTLEFYVEPQSLPPTNIHILIGRNGVGKTTLLSNLARALCRARGVTDVHGEIRFVGAQIG